MIYVYENCMILYLLSLYEQINWISTQRNNNDEIKSPNEALKINNIKDVWLLDSSSDDAKNIETNKSKIH